MNKFIALFTLLMILGLINYSIWQKEQHLTNGQRVLLKLAPVDPRSMMQGDYMRLDFEIARQIRKQLAESNHPALFNDGFVVVQLDQHGVARFVRLDNDEVLLSGQLKLQFRVRYNRIKFATNAYFFEEGEGDKYQLAQYGEFKVDPKGHVLLNKLLTADFVEI